MKITSVDIIKLHGKHPVAGWVFTPTVVRVNTDEGIYGLGEIGLAYGVSEHGQFGLARDFASKIIGMNPMQNEKIWEKLYRTTFWGMGGGTFVFAAMSALDIALWDIKGKALGVPVYELLGGKTNDHLRSYASQIQFDWGPVSAPMLTPEDYANATKKAMAEGYDCVKVDPIAYNSKGEFMTDRDCGLLMNREVRLFEERVAAIRETGGPNMDIILEMHALTDAVSAVQLAEVFEKYRIFYYEEPTAPLNPGNMKQIAQKVHIPIAAGERIYSRWGYRPFFEDHSIQVIQPDLGNCGGFTEGKKICDMANVYDVSAQIHVCGGPVAVAAALQLEAVIPNFLIHEHHAFSLLPENQRLCVYNYQPENGYYKIPDLPGIGQDLSEEGLANAEIETIK